MSDDETATGTPAETKPIAPPFYKRIYLIDKPSQLTILLYMIFVSLISVLLTTVIFTLNSEFVESDPELVLFAMAACFMAVLLFVFLGLSLSNRIAGPIYKLRLHMKAVSRGDAVRTISFRRDDHFKGLADDYNGVLERLQRAEEAKR